VLESPAGVGDSRALETSEVKTTSRLGLVAKFGSGRRVVVVTEAVARLE